MPEDDFLKFVTTDLLSMEILLSTKSKVMALTIDQFIAFSLENGATLDSIEKQLIDDLRNNGRLFADFNRSIKTTSNGIIKRVADSGQFSTLEKIKTYRWVAVSDKNVCPDCIERHGKELTLDEWEEIGLPAMDFTLCQQNCRCALVPAEVVQIDPITLAEVK